MTTWPPSTPRRDRLPAAGRDDPRDTIGLARHSADDRFRAAGRGKQAYRTPAAGGDRHDRADPGRSPRTRRAAARRFDPEQHLGRVRPPDLEHVGRRPDGGADGPAPPVRLAAPGRPGQRPPDLFQGARVPAAVLDVQGGRGGLRRGADDRVPPVRLPAGRPPHAGAAVGRRGHRLARPGAAGRGRRRAGRPVPRRAAVPGLGLVRGQRNRRRLHLGSAGQSLLLPAAEPDRDHRRQPPRPARPDRTGLGHRRVRQAGRSVRLSRPGHRRARPRRDRPGLHPGGRGGPAHGDRGPYPQGPRLRRGRGPRRLARPGAARADGAAGHRSSSAASVTSPSPARGPRPERPGPGPTAR